MKILENQSATLTNHEVLAHLQTKNERYERLAQSRAARGYSTGKDENIDFVLRELSNYLENPTCQATPPSSLESTTVRRLFQALQPYDLTKAELIMFFNIRPNSLSVLDCIIEEMDQRFTEDSQRVILRILRDILDTDYQEETLDGEVGREQ